MFWKLKQKFSGDELVDMLQEAQERWDIDVKEESSGSGGATIEGTPVAEGVAINKGDTVRVYVLKSLEDTRGCRSMQILAYINNNNMTLLFAGEWMGNPSGCGYGYHDPMSQALPYSAAYDQPGVYEFEYTGENSTISSVSTYGNDDNAVVMTIISK